MDAAYQPHETQSAGITHLLPWAMLQCIKRNTASHIRVPTVRRNDD
jgi:hypothetical protein